MYDLYGIEFTLDDGIKNQMKYNDFLKGVAEDISNTFENVVNEHCNNDMIGLMNSCPEIMAAGIEQATEIILDELSNLGVYTYNKNMFFDLMDEHKIMRIWNKAVDPIEERYLELLQSAENEKIEREYRKASRTQFSGAGFGLGNAIAASAKAGMVNMATGAVHSMANSIGNSVTDSQLKKELNKLYDEAVPKLTQAVYMMIIMCMGPFSDIVSDEGCLDITFINSADAERAEAITNNIVKGNIPKEELPKNIYKSLCLNPKQEELFKFLLEEYGDPNGELLRLAEDLRMQEIAEYIDSIRERILCQISYSTKEEVLEGVDILSKAARWYCQDEECWLRPLNEILMIYEDEEKICDGYKYESSEQVREAVREKERFLELTTNVDGNAEKKLLKIKDEIEGFNSLAKEKYLTFIEDELKQYDIRRRTVRGKIFEKREDADEYREALRFLSKVLHSDKKVSSLKMAKTSIQESSYKGECVNQALKYLDLVLEIKEKLIDQIAILPNDSREKRSEALYKILYEYETLKYLNCVGPEEARKTEKIKAEMFSVKGKTYESLKEANECYIDTLKHANMYRDNVVNKETTTQSLFGKLKNGAKELWSKAYDKDYEYMTSIYGVEFPSYNDDLKKEYETQYGTYNEHLSDLEKKYGKMFDGIGEKSEIEPKKIDGTTIIVNNEGLTNEKLKEVMYKYVSKDNIEKIIV